MGNGRFLYNNYITGSSMILATSLITGFVTAPYKEGQGSGDIKTYGNYTGAEDLEYVVEIDSTASGREVGESEFRWRDGATWDASTITTQTSYALSNGVYISFTSAAGDDFLLGDIWYFKGINLFNPGKLIDLDRNTRYRAATASSVSVIKLDLGAAKEVKALILYDHNFTSNATIVLKGGTATDCGQFSTTLSWSSQHIIHYPATNPTYQYWQVDIGDAASTNIELSELYLGNYFEPADNFEVDSEHPMEIVGDKYYTPYGARRDIYRNKKETINLSYPYMKTTDRDNFNTMIGAITNQETKKYNPVFFNYNSTIPSETRLYKINAYNEVRHKARYSIRLQLEEMVKSV